MPRILIIEDNRSFREFLAQLLSDHGYQVLEAHTAEEAFKTLDLQTVDLVLCDLEIPFTVSTEFFDYHYSCLVGARTIKELRWAMPNIPVIAMSALPNSLVREVQGEFAGMPFLAKPFKSYELLTLIAALMDTNPCQLVN